MTLRRTLRGLEGLERRDLLAVDIPLADSSDGLLVSLSQFDRVPTLMGPAQLATASLVAGPNHYIVSFPPTEDQGEITAEVIDGVLTIRGDAKGNSIGIWSWGRNSIFLSAQRINGQAALGSWMNPPGGMIIDGVTGGIDIDLGDGDDYVGLQGSFSDIEIRLGAGNDRILLGGESEFPFKNFVTASIKWPRAASISGDLIIDTGAGNDELIAYAYVEGDVNVQMGAGDDSFVLPHWTVIGQATFAELRARGQRVIDLGADESPSVDEVPDDWRSDPTLAGKLDSELVDAFATIEQAEAAGANLNGRDITWYPADGGEPFRTNRNGRLEIEFRFAPAGDDYSSQYEGLTSMNQLRNRGLRLDRFSLSLGLGYAVIHESELALFANLPAITRIQLRGVADITDLPGRGWSYVRPANVSILDPLEPTSPPIGPQRPSDVPGEQGLSSLLDSYYGRGRVMGPRTL